MPRVLAVDLTSAVVYLPERQKGDPYLRQVRGAEYGCDLLARMIGGRGVHGPLTAVKIRIGAVADCTWRARRV